MDVSGVLVLQLGEIGHLRDVPTDQAERASLRGLPTEHGEQQRDVAEGPLQVHIVE